MSKVRERHSPVSAARRGQIIQHILVDGWSEADAAAKYRVSRRHVAAWVKSYRRHGMASLRRESGPVADVAAGMGRWLHAAAAAIKRAFRRPAKIPVPGTTNAAILKRRDP